MKKTLSRQAVSETYTRPLMNLLYEAHTVHRDNFDPNQVQKSQLLSIRTGSCSEDCSYCAQSSRYKTDVTKLEKLSRAEVMEHAKEAKAGGSSRFCMGSSGRSAADGRDFDEVLTMISDIKSLGMEACVTLGMLTDEQAKRLKDAGLDYYNHNLDTSPEYYDKIITTHSYEERIGTISHIRAAGLHLCAGGIIGLGESRDDRVSLIYELAALDPPPDSIPVNRLVPIHGTPLQDTPEIDPLEIIRTIATIRIWMPTSRIRLAAGRESMSDVLQAICFFAGANSIFAGEKLLTTPGAAKGADRDLFERLGLTTL